MQNYSRSFSNINFERIIFYKTVNLFFFVIHKLNFNSLEAQEGSAFLNLKTKEYYFGSSVRVWSDGGGILALDLDVIATVPAILLILFRGVIYKTRRFYLERV